MRLFSVLTKIYETLAEKVFVHIWCRRADKSGDMTILILLSVFLPSIVPSLSIRIAGPREIIEILNNPAYDKYLTPTQLDGLPTQVIIGLYIEGMSSIRAQTMDFHADIYFEQKWTDERLKHSSKHRVMIKDPAILLMMWHPDLYFANANSAKFFDVTEPNFLMWIFPNGTVHHDLRISLTVLCNMDFTKYPLDSQECDLRILSYAYTVEQLNISWRDKEPISMNNQLRLPDMQITHSLAAYCDGTYIHGNWSCVRSVFSLRREQMHHILQNYVPTMLIVIISWFSFWLDVESVPGRVSLCITTLLTLATQASSARLALPQVSYVKAIDVWLEACLGFVFGVLIEFTIVNYLARVGPGFGSGSRKRRSGGLTAELLVTGGRKTVSAVAGRKFSVKKPHSVNMNGANSEAESFVEHLLRELGAATNYDYAMHAIEEMDQERITPNVAYSCCSVPNVKRRKSNLMCTEDEESLNKSIVV